MTREIRVLRRNRQVVPWRIDKIEIAIRKAFLNEGQGGDEAPQLARRVEEKILQRGLLLVDIESIQDAVQEELRLAGFTAVADAYGAYRQSRQKQRQPLQNTPAHSETAPLIQNSDGQGTLFNGAGTIRRLHWASQDLKLALSAEAILEKVRAKFTTEMSQQTLRQHFLDTLLELAERDPLYAKMATRLLLSFAYEDVLQYRVEDGTAETLKAAHGQYFKDYIARGVREKWLDPRLAEFDLETLADALDCRWDREWDWRGLWLLWQEFLLQEDGQRREVPQIFWMRVAMGILLEDAGRSEANVIALYRTLCRREFCPSTPTLLYAGTTHPHLLPSYVYRLQDSLHDIMDRGIAENAFISKWGAGLGGCWTAIRGRGSPIDGTRGESEGVLPFLELHQKQLAIANQGKYRRSGAGCAYLDLWHWDCSAFIALYGQLKSELRRGELPELQTCLLIPDLFMKRLNEPHCQWTLFQPNDVADLQDLWGEEFEQRYLQYEQLAQENKMESYSLPVAQLWQQILALIFETGFPRLAFRDGMNRRNMLAAQGIIPSSSLFGENAFNVSKSETGASAFGSISLAAHLREDQSFDFEKLRRTIALAVSALDAVLDVTKFSNGHTAAHIANYRALSLGFCGLHDCLQRQGIPYDSEAAVTFAENVSEFLAYHSILASSELAAARGVCPAFENSEWQAGKLPQNTIPSASKLELPWEDLSQILRDRGLRNAYLLAFSPTQRIAQLLGTSPGIQPRLRNVWPVKLSHGDVRWILEPALANALQRAGLWTENFADQFHYLEGDLEGMEGIPVPLKRIYGTAFQLSAEVSLEMAAAVQIWLDQSQYFPVYMRQPTFSQLAAQIQQAWRRHIKTIGPVITSNQLLHDKAMAKFTDR